MALENDEKTSFWEQNQWEGVHQGFTSVLVISGGLMFMLKVMCNAANRKSQTMFRGFKDVSS